MATNFYRYITILRSANKKAGAMPRLSRISINIYSKTIFSVLTPLALAIFTK